VCSTYIQCVCGCQRSSSDISRYTTLNQAPHALPPTSAATGAVKPELWAMATSLRSKSLRQTVYASSTPGLPPKPQSMCRDWAVQNPGHPSHKEHLLCSVHPCNVGAGDVVSTAYDKGLTRNDTSHVSNCDFANLQVINHLLVYGLHT